MRRAIIALALCLGLIRTSAAAKEDNPAQVIQRAIEACGGAEKLKPGRCGYSKVEGKHPKAESYPVPQAETWTEFPNRCKVVVRCATPKGPQRQTVVVEDAAGWVQDEDRPANDLDPATLTVQRDMFYRGYVIRFSASFCWRIKSSS